MNSDDVEFGPNGPAPERSQLEGMIEEAAEESRGSTTCAGYYLLSCAFLLVGAACFALIVWAN